MTHSTGAAIATSQVIPSLNERMSGISYIVPTLDGSFANMYFVAISDEKLSEKFLNDLIKNNIKNTKYANRLGIFEGKDAGTFDIIGRRENTIVILSKTNVIPLNFSPEKKYASLVTLISCYDNELGPSIDTALLARYISSKSKLSLNS